MSRFNLCPKCSVWHFDGDKCAEPYTIFHPDYLGEGGRVFSGYSAEDAAERYAKYYNEDGAEYPLLNGVDAIEIEVEDQNGTRQKFRIYAEQAIDYHVSEIVTM